MTRRRALTCTMSGVAGSPAVPSTDSLGFFGNDQF